MPNQDASYIDPEETPVPLEGEISGEQNEWDSEPPLSLEDQRTILQQRSFWVSAHYFGYDTDILGNGENAVDPYVVANNPVQVFWKNRRSADFKKIAVSTNNDASVREAFEEHFTRATSNGEKVSYKFAWKKNSVTITHAS